MNEKSIGVTNSVHDRYSYAWLSSTEIRKRRNYQLKCRVRTIVLFMMLVKFTFNLRAANGPTGKNLYFGFLYDVLNTC